MIHEQGSSERAVRVLIVGSGFAGINAAIMLRARGIGEFVILERGASLGGTWRDNRYPGCACDVESVLYSYSFAPNPDWSRTFAGSAEIARYLQRVATEYEVGPHIRYGEEVTDARWDEEAQRWLVRSTSGAWAAEHLIVATGALSDPVRPAIPGLDSFAGPCFHTAEWDEGIALEGKRVAIIGTGASAIQVIPAIQPKVRELKVVQRTPAWVIPRHDRAIPAWRRALYAQVPLMQRLARGLQYLRHEILFVPFRHRWARRLAQGILGRHLARQVRDPQLRARLTPRYDIGCKRLLLSDDYYPAMSQPNVTLVDQAVTQVTPTGFVTADGTAHEVDVLLLATGFRPTDPPLAPHIRGREGRSLGEIWAGSPTAYLGTTVAGFPNLALLNGPNTGLGHSSVLMMFEAQCEHLNGLFDLLALSGAQTAEPTAEAQARYVARIDAGHRNTVWQRGGCQSWYLDRTGRNSTLWPYGVGRFRQTVTQVVPADYRLAGLAEHRD
ncbi:MAG: flavin-containing monooxygenase [Gemmatimonadaceae bacterium]